MSTEKILRLERRRRRISHKISSVAQRNDMLRILVRKSNRHIYIQLIDDVNKKVLSGVSTLSKDLKNSNKDLSCNKSSAKMIGDYFANKIAELKRDFVFDRGGYKYTGVVQEIADAIRAKGVKL